MESVSRSANFNTSPAAFARYVGDGSNLPLWAPGFADDVKRLASGLWLVRKEEREFELEIKISHDQRSIDFVRDLPEGGRGGANVRILDAPDGGSMVIMTLPVGPGLSAVDMLRIIDEELSRLFTLLVEKDEDEAGSSSG